MGDRPRRPGLRNRQKVDYTFSDKVVARDVFATARHDYRGNFDPLAGPREVNHI